MSGFFLPFLSPFGRLRRVAFVWRTLLVLAVSLAVFVAAMTTSHELQYPPVLALVGLSILIMLACGFNLAAQRLSDIGVPGLVATTPTLVRGLWMYALSRFNLFVHDIWSDVLVTAFLLDLALLIGLAIWPGRTAPDADGLV